MEIVANNSQFPNFVHYLNTEEFTLEPFLLSCHSLCPAVSQTRVVHSVAYSLGQVLLDSCQDPKHTRMELVDPVASSRRKAGAPSLLLELLEGKSGYTGHLTKESLVSQG